MSEVGLSDLTLHQALQNLRVAEGDEPASPTPFDRLLISYPDAVSVMRERARAREAAQKLARRRRGLRPRFGSFARRRPIHDLAGALPNARR